MKPVQKDVAEYIESFEPDIRARLYAIRQAVLELAPEADEGIKYRMPTILWHGNLLHYAAFSKHIGVYPLPHVLEKLKDELTGYAQGKGSIQFPNDKPLPLDLIRRIASERLREREEALALKAAAKAAVKATRRLE